MRNLLELCFCEESEGGMLLNVFAREAYANVIQCMAGRAPQAPPISKRRRETGPPSARTHADEAAHEGVHRPRRSHRATGGKGKASGSRTETRGPNPREEEKEQRPR